MHVKRSSLENYPLFPYWQTKKNLFSRLFQAGKQPKFFHTFPDSVGILQTAHETIKAWRASAFCGKAMRSTNLGLAATLNSWWQQGAVLDDAGRSVFVAEKYVFDLHHGLLEVAVVGLVTTGVAVTTLQHTIQIRWSPYNSQKKTFRMFEFIASRNLTQQPKARALNYVTMAHRRGRKVIVRENLGKRDTVAECSKLKKKCTIHFNGFKAATTFPSLLYLIIFNTVLRNSRGPFLTGILVQTLWK